MELYSRETSNGKLLMSDSDLEYLNTGIYYVEYTYVYNMTGEYNMYTLIVGEIFFSLAITDSKPVI